MRNKTEIKNSQAGGVHADEPGAARDGNESVLVVITRVATGSDPAHLRAP